MHAPFERQSGIFSSRTAQEFVRGLAGFIVYAIVDDALSPDFPLGVFVRRGDDERFIEEVRGDEPEMAAKLRIEERELEAGRLN